MRVGFASYLYIVAWPSSVDAVLLGSSFNWQDGVFFKLIWCGQTFQFEFNQIKLFQTYWSFLFRILNNFCNEIREGEGEGKIEILSCSSLCIGSVVLCIYRHILQCNYTFEQVVDMICGFCFVDLTRFQVALVKISLDFPDLLLSWIQQFSITSIS